MRIQIVTILLLFFSLNSLDAQNLEKIGDKDIFQIHGGLNFNAVNYFVSGMDRRRDPFTWFSNGNININFLDVSVPFTYSYSNLGGKFTQPFNQYGLHPTYKWIKAHAGYHSMSFSNYSLAGHLFLGGGLELTPGKWNFQLMGGRLNKEIEYDAGSDNLNQIVYRRIGFGLKAGYKSGQNEIQMIMFKAFDEGNSLRFIPIGSEVKPMDNIVGSLVGKAILIKKISLDGEMACSGLTQNLRNSIELNSVEKHPLGGLLVVNETTRFYYAYKFSIGYKFTKSNLAVNFEHIDPEYRTLGGYFFNNDLENYTISYNGTFFQNKFNFGINAGYQFNNLSGQKVATTKRIISSLNLGFNPGKKWMLNGTYSNFSNFTKNRLQTDPYYSNLGDTLNFYNLTQNASINSVFRFGNGTQHSLQTMLNYNQCINTTGAFNSVGIYGIGAPIGASVNVYTGNFIYGFQQKSIKLTMNGGLNTNYSESISTNAMFIGPLVNFTKTFGNRFNLVSGVIYNKQFTNDKLVSDIVNSKLGISYKFSFGTKVKSSFNFSCNANWMIRNPVDETMNKVNELNVFTTVSYAF